MNEKQNLKSWIYNQAVVNEMVLKMQDKCQFPISQPKRNHRNNLFAIKTFMKQI